MNKRELRKWRDTYTRWDGTCFTEGLRLAVHFDEKDHVKRIGGRWEPDPSGKGGYWWMPADKINGAMPSDVPEIVNTFDDKIDPDAMADGISRLEWLNRNMMINGTHGAVNKDAALGAIEGMSPIEHMVQNPNTSEYGHFYVFASAGLVSWTEEGANPNYNHHFMTIEQSREMWDSLMAAGYRPVISATSEVSS